MPHSDAEPATIRAFPRPREPVSLRRLFPTASFVGCADVRVTDAVEVAQRCRPGVLFAARPGGRHDGAAFAAEAVRRGATALLVEDPLAEIAVPQCVVPDVGRAFGIVCATVAGRPMRSVRTVGVTGTNGKTTVTWLVRSLLRSAGKSCGLLGTVEYDDGAKTAAAPLTTPDARTFWDWFAAMAVRRTGFAAVELSSHALHQDRVAGAELEVALLTNLTHDHLDYHKTPAAYLASKAKIVNLVRTGGTVILNQDDAAADALRACVPAGIDVLTFSIGRRAAVVAEQVAPSSDGMRFTLSLRGRRARIETPLVGTHNVANCLAAAAVCERFGLTIDEIVAGLAAAASPPGRMERVAAGGPFQVFVDYAHTPDALDKAIAAARSVAAGRVIVVFGAGGDRDPSKRPALGAAASAADAAIVTSDNPRSECPLRIIDGVLNGFDAGRSEAFVEPDRGRAIDLAVSIAEPGDVVLIAGKGHETVQVLADKVLPFDDRLAATAAVRRRLPQPIQAKRRAA